MTRIDNRSEDMTNPPNITQLEMTSAEIELCEKAAKRLGYTQTAYASSSAIWGLFCLRDHPTSHSGVFFKTKEFGLVFLQDMEDLRMTDL